MVDTSRDSICCWLRCCLRASWVGALLAVISAGGMLGRTAVASAAQPAAAAAAAPAAESTYSNPVIRTGSADPHVLKASDGRYYMYNTFGFAVHSSDDLVHWRYEGSAMPYGSWGVRDFWAPEVVEYQGRFYLFYSAERAEGGKRIGVAVGDRPAGPFRDLGRPLFDPGFAVIDAHVFVDDDGRAYLYFAQDQAPQGAGRYESRLYGVELAADLLSVAGEAVELTRPEQAWERRSGGRLWNEAPFVIKRDGLYYLMYSANCYCGADYSVGYATAEHPLGPYTKHPENPILSRGSWQGRLSGPGHHAVVESPDGSELWIVYHIHADPAVGGGDRRIAVDRMGLREDGSLYVSGPTLTAQPLPSGAGELVNLAPHATVTASSVKPGRSPAALVDGEFAVDPAKETWEWAADGERAGAWFRLTWTKEQRARWVFVYPSVAGARKAAAVALRTSGGTEIRGIELPSEPGAAAIVEIPDDRGFEWLEVIVEAMRGSGEAGMAEVMVLGSPAGLPGSDRGSVWLSSPRRGARIDAPAPVVLQAHHVDAREVALLLDGEEIFRTGAAGGSLLSSQPLDLASLELPWLDPAALDPGTHRLTAIAYDAGGREYRYTAEFAVEHLRVVSPEAGARLAGQVLVELQPGIAAEAITGVRVRWVPVGETARLTGVREAHASAGAVRWISLDARGVPDGAYDLEFEVATRAGKVSRVVRRVVVDNWEELDDPILPPSESSWFGSFVQIKTVSMSQGWEYATGDADRYFGDADRIRPAGGTPGQGGHATGSAQHLTWSLPGLAEFAVRVYAADPSALAPIKLSVSADGSAWADVPFAIHLVAGPEAPQGVSMFELKGEVDPGLAATLFRLAIDVGALVTAGPEIGHVTLRAPKNKSQQ